MARRQVLGASAAFLSRFGLPPADPAPIDAPLILTGHQPEPFHPGVWVKNFAAAAIARRVGGSALNLIVDNDVPKSASVRVPSPEADGLRVQAVEYDRWTGDVPYEDRRATDPGRFADFPDRLRDTLAGQVADPIVDSFWPLAVEAAGRTDRVGLRLAAARRALEAKWGVRNAEVPISDLCGTEAFSWFACHVLAHLPRFQAVHNAALERYRKAYHIRSKNHPVPELRAEDGWLEAPFWAWRAGPNARRRPLMARQDGRTLLLRIGGESKPLAGLPLAPDREACCAVEELRALAGQGVRVRTRALSTTMFSRLLLGDLFIHGIGGAKYDELGDEVIRGFFGLEPPGYLTLSLSVHLGLSESPSTADDLRRAEATLRDFQWNPDRHLFDPLPVSLTRLVEAKRAALDLPQATHRERASRFFAIRRANEALVPLVADRAAEVRSLRDSQAALLRREKVASSREYAFPAHSEARLRSAFAEVERQISPET